MKKFKNSKKNKNSYFLYRNSINLPSPLGLTNNQAKIVSFHIKKYLKKYNGR